ncbi:uncharacterized protein N7487_011655 [Penicillium crustosum]|uniref:uncharacterized protein n=1 Tax=Penicillium crustosum TaxID=36656 RepID=UPI00238D9F39|nr:uncharacterized protein N7487_011655 [Penicillium crustosum]KAJ5394014.1 hypothetical protein N7487_011655 [Penicillium crustosum]
MKESYTPLRAGSDEYEGTPENLAFLPESRQSLKPVWKKSGTLLLIAGNLLLFVVSLGFMAVSLAKGCSEQYCAALTSSYSPLLESTAGVIEYETVMFHGALEYENVYKGSPNKALDDAWSYIKHMGSTQVDAEVLPRINKSDIAVKFPAEYGGKYMSGIEVFHQLHCLDLVRKYTYREYYDLSENRPEEFTDSEPTLRKHVDHCIDMLRQYLMCAGDVGIVTMNWVEKFGIYPDFSTQHKCRKFDKIVEWADEHAAPSLPYNGGGSDLEC